MVSRLLKSGVDANTRIEDRPGLHLAGGTILHYAACEGHIKVLRLLLDRGANVNARTSDGETPLMAVAQKGCPAIAKLLLDRGADVNARDRERNTALHRAAIIGDTEVVKLLVKKGADVEASNREGLTPLSWAIRSRYNRHKGHDEVITLLEANGATVVSAADQRRFDSFMRWIGEQIRKK